MIVKVLIRIRKYSILLWNKNKTLMTLLIKASQSSTNKKTFSDSIPELRNKRLASSKYFSPVTADDTYNIAGHYLVQTGYENLSDPRKENSEPPCFSGRCTFVRRIRDADCCMLWQAEKRFWEALVDIQFLESDYNKVIYNAVLSECSSMTFHILGLEHTKKEYIPQFKRSKLS